MVENFNREVAGILCESLAMYLLDMTKLMEFELAEKDEIIEKCGLDYFEKLENKVIKSVTSYENTVILINYDLLTYKNNYQHFASNAYSFYLKFEKEKIKENKNVNIINQIAFSERDSILKSICQKTITLKNLNPKQAANRIIEQLKEVAL